MTIKPQVLEDVRNFLEYAKSLGMTEVSCQTANPPVSTPPLHPAMDPALKAAALEKVREEIGACTRCKLCKSRTHIVYGTGNSDAKLMFVGEGPGQDEDLQGIPFVGRAGQLLTRIIEAMKYKREDIYIANIVKCRPPNNRNPEPDEVATCIPFLKKQIAIVAPRAIVCLGSVAMQSLLETDAKITRMRGRFASWRDIPVMPTYHPAFLLRNPAMKKPVWEDMQKVMELLGKKI